MKAVCAKVIENIARVVVGKKEATRLLLVALLAEGHVLLEDVPGVGKTLLAKALAQSIGGRFQRIQFTPDLLPADITGFNFYNQHLGRFEFRSGPVKTNILLADEINRTVPRTQSSLLESMEEGQVTVDGSTKALPRPFFVIATQNPIELEGTFPLPEAQLDRFLLCVRLGYPSEAEETAILKRFQDQDPLDALTAVTDPEQISALQRHRENISVSSPVRAYIVDLVTRTRSHISLEFGASPRASLNLMRAAQAFALIADRDYVLPDDVKYLAPFVLGHRLVLKPTERLRGITADGIVAKLLETVPVPAPVEGELIHA